MQKICIRIDLKTEIAEKFLHVKKQLGFTTNTAVVTYLINDAYEKNMKGAS